MENTNLEKWQNKMNNYVNKTAKHLFIDENNRMFKVIPFKHGDKNMVATIRFSEDYFWMTFREVSAKSSNSLFYMKTSFFPQWGKATSIPNYKRMRELSEYIKDYLEKEYDGEAESTSKIKDFVKNLVKSEKFIKKDLTSNE